MSVYDRISLAHCIGEPEALRVAARQAEDSGDFEGALRLVLRLPEEFDTVHWKRQLRRAVELPDTGAQIARWLVHPALRWALEQPSGQLLEVYARLMVTTVGVPAPDREEKIAAATVSDAVVVDAGLFDGGLFRRYLTSAVGACLLARAGPVGQWSEWPASVWVLERQLADRAVLRDCWTGARMECLPTAAAIEEPDGAFLYGRLVPVAGRVRLAFVLAPVVVDRRCASRLVRARHRGSGPDERIRAIAHNRRRQQIDHDRSQ